MAPNTPVVVLARGKGGQKRKDAPGNSTSLDKPPKRRAQSRVYDARNIPSQEPHEALKDGQLDLQTFLSAHEFEINALEESMRLSKSASASRAFQKVPQFLRRRTASHNVKRVPRRLRPRARREILEDNVPTVEARRRTPRTTRSRIRAETAKRLRILSKKRLARQARAAKEKAKEAAAEGKTIPETSQSKGTERGVSLARGPRPKIRRDALNGPHRVQSKFRRRQIHKTWLPTHVWHAKRARMTEPSRPLWRFAVPLTPNEKSFRPTYRSQGDRGAVAWDTTYMSTIGVFGSPSNLERVLKALGVADPSCWGQKGKKWRVGARSWSGILSRESGSRRRDICPCTIVWNPEDPEPEKGPSTSREKNGREVFLRVHPAAFLEVFNTLLRLAKMEKPRVHVEDLRFEIGSIEITGPSSTESLLSILRPHPRSEVGSSHAATLHSLSRLTDPASLPTNAMLAFSIKDPRLNFPPKTVVPDAESTHPAFLETLASWKVDNEPRPIQLWRRDARWDASKLPSKKSIDRRNSLKPRGQLLRPTPADPPIPILLLATRGPTNTQTPGTWVLLAPWKCIQPLWYSLVHYRTSSGGRLRFGGLNESRQVAFERASPWFPADFPGTDSGATWELEERERRFAEWDRRPKNKRTQWDAVDLGAGRRGEIGDGLSCDFEYLFSHIHTQTVQDTDAMDLDTQSTPNKPHNKDEFLLASVQSLSQTQLTSVLKTTLEPPPFTLLTIRLTLLSRGIVSTCARIYRLPSTNEPNSQPKPSQNHTQSDNSEPPSSQQSLPSNLREKWLDLIPSKRNATQRTDPQRTYPPVPDAKDLIGFVTSGSFTLSEGRATAIGSISAQRVIGDLRDRKAGRAASLCIVRDAGEKVGWLARWEVIS